MGLCRYRKKTFSMINSCKFFNVELMKIKLTEKRMLLRNFKKLVMLVFLFCGLAATQADAQELETRIGIKGGLNLSNLYVDDVDDENARVGFHAGIFAKMQITSFFALQPELLYSTKGAKAEGAFGDGKFNLAYIDLPVLAVINLGENFNIHAGPYVSYLISSSVSTEDGFFSDESTSLDRDNFNSFDYGVAAGIGFNFGAASLGIRYNLGLNEIANGTVSGLALGDSKNSVAQLYLSFGL